MTIAALQLQNATSKTVNFKVTGIGANIKLYADSFADLPLVVSSLSINRGESNYIVINVPVDEDTLGAILVMAATARINMTLLLFTEQSKSYVGSNFDLDLADFRYDQGTDSISVSLVSRSPINIPASAQTEIVVYQSRQKLSAPDTRYLYTVSPFDYLRYSIGTTVNDDVITGVIVGSKLNLGGRQAPQFTIEVEPNP